MIEIKVYKTSEEATQELGKYEQANREAFEGFIKRQGESASERLGKQTYFFVAELAAYVDECPTRQFYFESTAFPFIGWNSSCDDIELLVKGIKNAVRHLTPKNIETILYTVEDHNAKNLEFKKNAEGCWSPDKIYGDEKDEFSKKERDKIARVIESIKESIKNTEERGLTEQEREEFERIYSFKSKAGKRGKSDSDLPRGFDPDD